MNVSEHYLTYLKNKKNKKINWLDLKDQGISKENIGDKNMVFLVEGKVTNFIDLNLAGLVEGVFKLQFFYLADRKEPILKCYAPKAIKTFPSKYLDYEFSPAEMHELYTNNRLNSCVKMEDAKGENKRTVILEYDNDLSEIIETPIDAFNVYAGMVIKDYKLTEEDVNTLRRGETLSIPMQNNKGRTSIFRCYLSVLGKENENKIMRLKEVDLLT